MTDELKQNNTPPPKKGGCLRCCVISFLLMILCLILAVGTLYFVGRAYLSEHYPDWREKYPMFDIVSELIELKRDLDVMTELESKSPERIPGKTEKAAMPDDIPLISEVQSEAFSISDERITAWQYVTMSAETAQNTMNTNMTANGWYLKLSQDLPDGRQTIWEKNNRICTIEFFAQNGNAEIWIRCDVIQSNP